MFEANLPIPQKAELRIPMSTLWSALRLKTSEPLPKLVRRDNKIQQNVKTGKFVFFQLVQLLLFDSFGNLNTY